MLPCAVLQDQVWEPVMLCTQVWMIIDELCMTRHKQTLWIGSFDCLCHSEVTVKLIPVVFSMVFSRSVDGNGIHH